MMCYDMIRHGMVCSDLMCTENNRSQLSPTQNIKIKKSWSYKN